jgi:hypothetical protein
VGCWSSLLGRRADTASTVRKRLPGYGSSRGRSCGLTLEEIKELVFGLPGLIPHERSARVVEASIQLNYTTVL